MSLVRPVIYSLLMLTVTASAGFAMSGNGCGGDCVSCHSLTVSEANQILAGLGQVVKVGPAPVRGLFEVTLQKEGKTGVAYLDYGKKHLIGGQIIEIGERRPVGSPVAVQKWVDPAKLSSENSLVMGNPKGKKRLYVFTDPECPFCARLHGELKKLVALEPDLAVYLKLFPLKMHPNAYDKARVILGRGSLALLEKSFAGGKLPAPGPRDGKKPIDETIRLASSEGIDSTPTLVLSDGKVVVGGGTADEMRALLDQVTSGDHAR
jgi:thiol:disulfide interchange protein DsbC